MARKNNLPRDANGNILPGPGRPKGAKSARGQLVEKLDKMLSKKENVKLLIDGLEENLAENPARFFKQIVMPLLPKETKVLKDTQVTHELGNMAQTVLAAIQQDSAKGDDDNIIDVDVEIKDIPDDEK